MLAAATFVIFFQGYMVAPIIPTLSSIFGSSSQTVGLIVPAYLIPYGIATLAYGILADRIGIHRVMFASLAAFSALTILTATAQSIEQLALWRIGTGIGASGVVPLALTLVGRLYPYEQRGRPLGWLFGAMAGEWPSVLHWERCSFPSFAGKAFSFWSVLPARDFCLPFCLIAPSLPPRFSP